MRATLLAMVVVAIFAASCSKPMAVAHTDEVRYFSRDYAAVPNDTYYAVRWALKENDLSVAEEDLPGGIVKTAWVPVTSDSHYIEVFDRRDFGVTNSYFQLEIHLVDRGGRTVVKVGSHVKTLVNNLHSSGIVEYAVLNDIGNYLRKSSPDLTNLGIEK
jgi:hypothetical protein